MSGYRIYSARLSNNIVATNERVLLNVQVISWDWVKKQVLSWDELKNRFSKWGDMIGN